MAEAQRGNAGAFNELVRRHQNLAFGIARRMLANEDQAADVTQDAFFSAYQRIRDLRGGFRSWLCRIVVNGCYDVLRKRGREFSLEALQETTEGGEDPTLEPVDEGLGPEEAALRAELRRSLEASISLLPPDQRWAVVLVDVEGLSYAEAATALRCELGTLKSRLNRARLRLRDEVLKNAELSSLLDRPTLGGVY